eukprot:445120_1
MSTNIEYPTGIITFTHILSAILIIISIYGNIQLWQNKNAMFIQKRSPSIVFGLNTSFILIMIGLETMIIFFAHFPIQLLYIIPVVLMFFSIWLLFCMLITKTWMLYFKIKWTHYTLEYQWQQLINSNVLSLQMSDQQNWFIINNNKYGNLGFMYKCIGSLCFIAFIIVVIPSIFAVVHNFPTSMMITLAICVCFTVVPAVIIYVIIIKKTPTFEDNLFIHWESKIHSKILIFWIIINVFGNILSSIFQTITIWVYIAPVFQLIWFAMNFVSTFIISEKNRAMSSETGKAETSTHITLDMVLSNKTAFHWFMLHLSQEYSMECALSYIEFMQYQNYLLQSINMATINKIRHTRFPSNIPISEIIEYDDKLPDDYEGDILLSVAKIKAHKIFNKYVKNYAEFEINISFEQRGRLRNILGDLESLFELEIDKKDLFVIFEPCKEEMLVYLMHSLQRFQRKNIWSEQVVPVFPKPETDELSEHEVNEMMEVISTIEDL